MSWHGIVVERGGKLEFKHVEIRDATYGIHAQPGSDFVVDYADIGTTFKAALIGFDGDLRPHALPRCHASTPRPNRLRHSTTITYSSGGALIDPSCFRSEPRTNTRRRAERPGPPACSSPQQEWLVLQDGEKDGSSDGRNPSSRPNDHDARLSRHRRRRRSPFRHRP